MLIEFWTSNSKLLYSIKKKKKVSKQMETMTTSTEAAWKEHLAHKLSKKLHKRHVSMYIGHFSEKLDSEKTKKKYDCAL